MHFSLDTATFDFGFCVWGLEFYVCAWGAWLARTGGTTGTEQGQPGKLCRFAMPLAIE
jgi:hypothetical protein